MITRLYVNDLPDGIKCKVRMYADDVVLYTTIKPAEDFDHTLQADLDELSRWCQAWKMSVNVSKCDIMRISESMSTAEPIYSNALNISVVKNSNTWEYIYQIHAHAVWSNSENWVGKQV